MEISEVQSLIDDFFQNNSLCEFEKVLWQNGEPVCCLEIKVRDSEIMLNNIRVVEEQDNKGHATTAIKMLQSISEHSKFIITAIIEPNGKKQLTKKQLEKWYKKLNFQVKNGKITYFPQSLY
jgi:hypothetical protein